MHVSIRGEGRGIEVTYVPNSAEIGILNTINGFADKGFTKDVNVELSTLEHNALYNLKCNGFIKNVSDSMYKEVWVLTHLGKAIITHLNQEAK